MADVTGHSGQGREDHEEVQGVLIEDLIQVSSALDLGKEGFLKVREGLVGEESIDEDHGSVADTSDSWHLRGYALVSIAHGVPARDVHCECFDDGSFELDALQPVGVDLRISGS